MKDRVNLPRWWELHFECDWSKYFLDSEGSKSFGSQFSRGMHRGDVLAFKPHFISFLECWQLPFVLLFHDVRGNLIRAFSICSGLAELRKAMLDGGNCGLFIHFQEPTWLVSHEKIERGLLGGGMLSRIMGKFSEKEELRPIVLLIITECSQELFKFLIDTFCSSVRLGVVGCGESLGNL